MIIDHLTLFTWIDQWKKQNKTKQFHDIRHTLKITARQILENIVKTAHPNEPWGNVSLTNVCVCVHLCTKYTINLRRLNPLYISYLIFTLIYKFSIIAILQRSKLKQQKVVQEGRLWEKSFYTVSLMPAMINLLYYGE